MGKFHQAPHVYVGEIQLKVKELAHSISFYEEIIGLRVLERSDDRAVLTANGTTPLVTLIQPTDIIPRAEGYSGLFHYALLLPERGDLAVFLRHLMQTGYPF